MTRSASGARQGGDDYQHLVAWTRTLLALRTPENVVEIGLEAPDAGNVDDVTITYTDQRSEFSQVKYSVDASSPINLDEDNSSYADDVTPVLGYRPTSWCYGLRASESRRRATHLYSRRGHWPNTAGGWTCAPLWRWELIDVYAWLHTHNIPLCPIYDRLTQLGCPPADQRVGFVFGGGGGPTRYTWLRQGWPHLWTEYTTRWPHLAHTTET